MKKIIVIVFAVLLVLGLGVAGYNMFSVDRTSVEVGTEDGSKSEKILKKVEDVGVKAWNIVFWILVIAVTTGAVLGVVIGVPFLMRWLGDRGYFWIRVPEMYAGFMLKDKKLHKVVIACSNRSKLDALIKAIGIPSGQSGYTLDGVKYVIVGDGGLQWIGLPWLGYELYSWYEESEDDKNPNTDPQYILYLGESTWDYTNPEEKPDSNPGDTAREQKRFVSEWGVDTKDPVQVTPKLVVSVEVMSPVKPVFDVKYYHEAIQKEILAGWKYAAQELEYFRYEDFKEGGQQQKGRADDLQTKAQEKLNEFIFVKSIVDHESKQINTSENSLITDPNEAHEEALVEIEKRRTPAEMIFHEYGIRLKRVRIRDIDPTDDEIRKSLQDKIKAQTRAAAEVETAKGKRDSTMIETKGKVFEINGVGNAEAGVIKKKLVAKADGLANIAKKLELKGDDKLVLYTAQMATQMTENAQYTYLSGRPGDIGTSILAAVDTMRNGLNKVKDGSESEAKLGLKEIKDAFNGLSEKDRKELLGAVEKAPKAEASEQAPETSEADEEDNNK